ncbi:MULTISPECIES: TIGR00730 family Rossman fold protein [unclassified Granulicatella]|uniref:LOG family protein n=1 Tax=unclassified Granulicatella TaxID=2630493 RepID=UPI00107317D7|nr:MULTISPECIES: TIGR00730 family Rossman fold protein [unclassified Granulicatella]MBF0779739.1 TIGR00730 family Rossman fold protein [Granulicatella sp. 19428wC4_WM01]TFU96258.1 TIGR00730 family Rossman fold protein [Granulicatella sp. WM01]
MNITVYCGANLGNRQDYTHHAIALGKWIAQHHQLIYGGGKVGLMGILADTVLENGGKVIGVIPEFLVERELAHEHLSEIHIVKNMHERKAKMISLGNAYIALPGGPGTLEEISEVISWSRIGQHHNPCIFYNETGYFNSLKHFFENMISEGFLSTKDYNSILFATSIQDIETFIQNYTPPQIRQYH